MRRVLKLANTVSYVTEEPFLGDEALFRFGGKVFHGYADLRAHTFGTVPHLLAVWDGKRTRRTGGTYDILSRWPDRRRRRVIILNDLLRAAPPSGLAESPGATVTQVPASAPSQAPRSFKRVIKTMLFADVVGYSTLGEERTPLFLYEFLERVAGHLPTQPEFVNTWGDAIFAVMDEEEALPIAEYAFALQHAVCDTKWTDLGLPAQMSIRIALHAGPAYQGTDPITKSKNFYGSHVNRAARLEPVTPPGLIYATEQFAALLTTSQEAAEPETKGKRRRHQRPFVCEYVGTLALAKQFGSQAVYHVRRRTPGEE